MPTDCLLLIGAGGHAKVVFDAVRTADRALQLEVRDDDTRKSGYALLDMEIRIPVGDPETWPECVHVAVGDNSARRRLGESVLAAKKILYTVVHPSASVSSFARLGPGVFIAARAVVGPATAVETGAIVNHGAVVDHDCSIGCWSHVAPGAVLGGTVRVGDMCLIGSGAVILPGITVGTGSVVGSGAVVTQNVEPGTTVIGIPAKPMIGHPARRSSS